MSTTTIPTLSRVALLLTAAVLIGSGAVLTGDPNDLIGAWLQIGLGVGLGFGAFAGTLSTGALVVAATSSLGLLVGRIGDSIAASSSAFGPEAYVVESALLALNIVAFVRVFSRRTTGAVGTPR
jgi:hypothetical protein